MHDAPPKPDLLMYAKLAQYAPGYVCGQLELTSACMQRCPMCASWRSDEPQGVMQMADVRGIFHQLNRIATFEHLTLTGGDPQSYTWLPFVAGLYRRFRLQLSTAMMRPPEEWYSKFDRVRISLDAVDPLTYKKMRGVWRPVPMQALEWMRGFDVEVSTLTTVNEHNVHTLPQIIETLTDYQKSNARFRRAIFLLEIRERMPDEVIMPFLEYAKWSSKFPLNTSFGESPLWAASMRETDLMRSCRCAVGDISFHIKCNGDVFPCCLIGGEAISTVADMKIGNIITDTLTSFGILQNTHRRMQARYYETRPECRKVCQWKQVIFNRMVKEATDARLAMP